MLLIRSHLVPLVHWQTGERPPRQSNLHRVDRAEDCHRRAQPHLLQRLQPELVLSRQGAEGEAKGTDARVHRGQGLNELFQHF